MTPDGEALSSRAIISVYRVSPIRSLSLALSFIIRSWSLLGVGGDDHGENGQEDEEDDEGVDPDRLLGQGRNMGPGPKKTPSMRLKNDMSGSFPFFPFDHRRPGGG